MTGQRGRHQGPQNEHRMPYENIGEHTGWIEPRNRNTYQCELHADLMKDCGTFGDVGVMRGDLPDKALFYEMEIKVLGGLLPRIRQRTGSCVGVSAARAYAHAMIGDVIIRGQGERVELPFPFMTYGAGRTIAGLQPGGDGSFGAVQARAAAEFGLMGYLEEIFPKPEFHAGWITYNAHDERQWAHKSTWPIDAKDLAKIAGEYLMGTVTKIESIDQLMHVIAQGYGVTMASTFGCRRPLITGNVLIACPCKRINHQTCCGGYWKHPSMGLIFLEDNSWGPDAYPPCPTLAKDGVRGSAWILEHDMQNIIRDGEVYAHSDTDGFPFRRDIWGSLGL